MLLIDSKHIRLVKTIFFISCILACKYIKKMLMCHENFTK